MAGGESRMMIDSVVWAQYINVTDTHTDSHVAIPNASPTQYASGNKNWVSSFRWGTSAPISPPIYAPGAPVLRHARVFVGEGVLGVTTDIRVSHNIINSIKMRCTQHQQTDAPAACPCVSCMAGRPGQNQSAIKSPLSGSPIPVRAALDVTQPAVAGQRAGKP